MLKKYFSKYKRSDLVWIIFIILVGIYAGNDTLYPYTHQELSLIGTSSGLSSALANIVLIDKFIISNRK